MRTFNERVFEDGALPAKVKQLIAVAVAHVTQCPYCIQGHTKATLRAGASREELMEAVWVAAEMRAGAALAHALLMLDTVEKRERKPPNSCPAASRRKSPNDAGPAAALRLWLGLGASPPCATPEAGCLPWSNWSAAVSSPPCRRCAPLYRQEC